MPNFSNWAWRSRYFNSEQKILLNHSHYLRQIPLIFRITLRTWLDLNSLSSFSVAHLWDCSQRLTFEWAEIGLESCDTIKNWLHRLEMEWHTQHKLQVCVIISPMCAEKRSFTQSQRLETKRCRGFIQNAKNNDALFERTCCSSSDFHFKKCFILIQLKCDYILEVRFFWKIFIVNLTLR